MRIFLILFVVFIMFNCKSEQKRTIEDNFIWIDMESPAKENTFQPFLFSSKDKLLMSWTEKLNDSLSSLNFAEFENGKWSDAVKIKQGYDWFVNWADFSAIAENKGNLITHYLPKSDEATFAYDVFIKQYSENNKKWNTSFKLHSDTTKTEHGFVTLLPYEEDSFFTAWLDGRNTSGGHDHHGEGAMTIRAAEVTFEGKVINEVELDAKTCDCCQTSAAITENGPIVVYRDRSDSEIRDIYISRYEDGDWTLPKPIFNDNWKISGCPVNGPKAVAENNMLAVAWFTNSSNEPKVNIIFSDDNGKTFKKPFQIDGGNPLGRVDVTFLNKENALVSWIEESKTEAEIRVAKVNIEKGKIMETTVAELQASRASGFPQMEMVDKELIIAYNDVEDGNNSIKLKKINLNIFFDE